MYSQDSFFTLSVPGQIGLLALSILLMVVMLFLACTLFQARPRAFRLGFGLLLFWLFVWISPQIYYQYYRFLFDGLPQQWVIWPPVTLERIAELLLFKAQPSLSAHAQGALGWAILLAASVKRRKLCRNAAN